MNPKYESARLFEDTALFPLRLKHYLSKYVQTHYLKVKLVCSVLGSNSRSVYVS